MVDSWPIKQQDNPKGVLLEDFAFYPGHISESLETDPSKKGDIVKVLDEVSGKRNTYEVVPDYKDVFKMNSKSGMFEYMTNLNNIINKLYEVEDNNNLLYQLWEDYSVKKQQSVADLRIALYKSCKEK